MNTVQNGLRSYRNNDISRQPRISEHALDILADIVSDIKSETRQRDNDRREPRATDVKQNREEFRDVLNRELSRSR